MRAETAEWNELLHHLAEDLQDRGKLTDPRWVHVFRSLPRHVFVPEFLEWESRQHTWRRTGRKDPAYLERVYSDVPLCVDGDPDGRWLCSTTTPGLMVRMLELLRIAGNDRVLEIGTGTGYNTALLATLLGSDRVVSVDVAYIDVARAKLGSLGLAPRLLRRDGCHGAEEFGPYDHILSTVAVERVPAAWARQVSSGGRVLSDLKIMNSCGNLVLLTKLPDGRLEGPFDRGYAAFMGMRHGDPATYPMPRQRSAPDALVTRPRPTRVPPKIWEHTLPWFVAGLRMPERLSFGLNFRDGVPSAAVLFGSTCHAEVDLGADAGEPAEVRIAGPHDVWAAVESAWDDWVSWGRPGWEQFGLTVRRDGEQIVWLGRPGSPLTWPVPTFE